VEDVVGHIRKEGGGYEDLSITARLYNLWMKESDSMTAHLNDYEGIISQLSA
jgi:hypothetical protein